MTISNLYKFYSYLIDNYCVDKVGSPMVNDANSDYVRFTLDFINENFASNIKIGDIADDLHISKTYLSSVFSKTTGVTISTYLNEIRCRNAMIFIKNGMPVTKAAYAVGYNDAAYFSRIFKKLKGYPPSEISEHM
jgi:YesN/AraC family two-component response regulator